MNRFFNNRFNKLASTHAMGAPWNRLLTYSKLQKYLLLITASLSLGMICIGRQPVLVNDFRETKSTTKLRKYVEAVEKYLRIIERIKTDNPNSITFFRKIGLAEGSGTRMTGKNRNDIWYTSPLNKFDESCSRLHLYLSKIGRNRQLCFFRLGWSYIQAVLIEGYENEKALQNNSVSLNGSRNSSFSIAKSKEDIGKSGVLNKKDASDKTACAMKFINARLNEITILDEHDVLYKKTYDTCLAPSLEYSEATMDFGNWISATIPRTEEGYCKPLWLPGKMKWSEFDLDVLKKLLRDEINRIIIHTASVERDLVRRKAALRDLQERQLENAGKNRNRPSFIKKSKENDTTEGEINVKSNLNEQEKLILCVIDEVYDYISSM